ncbi:MAG TPA: MBL fold metallo-hydrolase [Vicinamibacterales bacterium]|jgi:glyoxylase-like metal-dependent hydrolase (beta-lactamase superfamily II)|nr:MBL fold metallo-hydrolase [Vicinamibacterales bacterium]
MTRKLALCTIVIVGTLAISIRAAQQPPGDPIAAMLAQKPSLQALSIEKVRDNLFVMRGAGGNIAAFVTANGVVMVDSGLPGWGQSILTKLKTVTDKPVTTLINTHAHFDHASGNVEFPANVDIVTHANAKQYMENVHQVYGLAASPSNNIYKEHGGRGLPKRTFTRTLTIGSGNDRVELRYYGRAHTGGDAFVIFPALRIAHVGDVFPNKGLPIMDKNNGGAGVAYPDTVAAAAAGLAAMNVETLINGHMPTQTTIADMKQYADFTRAFVNAARDAKKAGKTVAQFAAEWKVPAGFSGYSLGLGDTAKNDAQVVWDESR